MTTFRLHHDLDEWDMDIALKDLDRVVSFCLPLTSTPPLHSFTPCSVFAPVCLRLSRRFDGRRVRPGHRGHRGDPDRGLLPAACGCGRHLLLPEQVWAAHVHCSELLRKSWTGGQEQGHRGRQGGLYVSLLPQSVSPSFSSVQLYLLYIATVHNKGYVKGLHKWL